MADRKITDHTAITGANTATGDVVEIVDVSDTTDGATGTNKKITRANLAAAVALEGVVAQDVIFDAVGDLAVGSGANTAAKLSASATPGLALVTDDDDKTLIWGRPSMLSGYVGLLRSSHFAETLQPGFTAAAVGVLTTSGYMYLTPIWLWEGQTVTTISFATSTTALSSPTNQIFGLYDTNNLTGGGARARLTYTVNDTTTAWAANTIKTLSCVGAGGAYTVTVSGLYHLASMTTQTGSASLVCSTSASALNSTAAHVYDSTGYTTTIPNPYVASAAMQNFLWAGVA